jgi:NAD(P)-dependent dehydrogenase (short-subunit alcohol dehydrogenase family)
LVDEVYDRLGRVDVLVNNAGMAPLYPSLPEVTEELFDKTVAVNLRGPFRLSTLVADRMARGAGGSIINISSIAAVHPSSHEVPYGVAKAGLNALTIVLASAYGPRVRANTLMLGPFKTDISDSWDWDAFERDIVPTIPAGRAGEASEIVGAAVFLASDDSSFISGATISVDGGWTAVAPGGRV